MPRNIQISDRTHQRVLKRRDDLARYLDRQVTITEMIDVALDEYDRNHPETLEKDAPEGTEQ